ncbi:SIS domain-containing protein [Candidatus Enterococcus clewellii]|uniref:Tagatose-6-phosphate ketose/aldose isomerase n=1 Tax=Candidatus Enterococcus clewellii TaxID=1834193 RepID=A0A242K487_9ENTE|nr:SIS domain-containing protein [Enterococcus sp. 9E7_DIV0242]OTP14338.1 hypothetical protein A5888_002439 [Enterococcus sp. 9E7_DIV0242]
MFEKTADILKEMGADITTGEIKQQPELWQETLEIYKKNEEAIYAFLEKIKRETQRKIRVIFTGAGTSQYVGDTLVPYLTRQGDTRNFSFESIGTTDIVGAPYDYLLPEEPTILVSFARSGNSPESLAAVAVADKLVKQLYHITITCAADGQLALAAEGKENILLLLMPPKSNDKGFAMTGSFTCMTLSALLIFDQEVLAQKEAYIQAMQEMGREVIQREAEIQTVLARDYHRIVYLGSGSLSGLTREAQLKVLELTAGQIATVFDSSLGFRHGPKSFVDKQTLLFVFVNNDGYTRKYDLDILSEVQGDGIAAAVVGIGQQVEDSLIGTPFVYSNKEVLLPEAYLAFPDILFAQTVALHSSIKVGNTPDTPSPTGTVNRVVQGVTIHEL